MHVWWPGTALSFLYDHAALHDAVTQRCYFTASQLPEATSHPACPLDLPKALLPSCCPALPPAGVGDVG